MIRTPFDTLAEYERRSLAHAVAQPAREIAQDQYRGVGYRVGKRRLISNFGEVVEIVPMPPVTPVPGAQPPVLRTRHPSHDIRREFMADGSHFAATADRVDWWSL